MGLPQVLLDRKNLGLDALVGLAKIITPIQAFTAIVGLVIAAFAGLYLFLTLFAHRPRAPLASELLFTTITRSGTRTAPAPLPTSFSPEHKPSLDISVIVPAYNESARLPSMLSEAYEHLTARHANSWEILIIDDGSSDSTATIALEWAARADHIAHTPDRLRVVSLARNRGKGGAVAHGMRHIRGRRAIFADADGASRFSDLAGLLAKLPSVGGYGIAVGSRAHMVSSSAVVQRSFVRNFLMHGFHALLRTVGVRDIADTQCGFKLFTADAARTVFMDLRTEGWIFDIEILLLARYKRIPVVEVPVSWHEVEGTKVSLVKDSVRMAWDLGVVRAGYAVGVYGVGPGGPPR